MLLKILKNIDRDRFNPTVISLVGLGEIGARIQDLGIKVQALNMSRSIPNPIMVLPLSVLLRQDKADIVHTWMYHADLLGGIAARLAGIKRVIWGIRHSNLSKAENKHSTLWVAKACAMLSRYLPAQILSCSTRAKAIHESFGYDAKKLHVIPNGFELERFSSDSSARVSVRNELGLDQNTPLVGLIARFNVQKNHLGFVSAAALVHAKLPNVHFVLVGSQVDASNSILKAAIAANGLQAHMHLLGRRDDVPRLMAALDVLASPSSGEGFPNVLGEAMASCVPCVVTDVGDSAEIVGGTGRVVPVGDMERFALEIVQMLGLSSDSKNALGHAARVRVSENYEIVNITRLYEAFYEKVMMN